MRACRKSVPELRRCTYVGGSEVEWHGVTPHTPDWSETSRFLAFAMGTAGGGLYVAFNTSHLPQMVQLPQWGGRLWQPYIDSGKVGSGWAGWLARVAWLWPGWAGPGILPCLH